jgi:hypothetical protein
MAETVLIDIEIPKKVCANIDAEIPEKKDIDFSISFHADMQIGTVETLPAGSNAYVLNVGTERNQIWNIGIPQGEQGPAGQDAKIIIRRL